MSNKKRKSKQQIKMTRQKISNIIILTVLLLMFLFFLAFFIRNLIICNNINSANLKEYSGAYTISKSHRLRNTIYFISLENGDVLRITPELLKSDYDFSEFSTLHFTYSEPEFGFVTTYTCVGISSANGDKCYMEIKDSLDEATIGVCAGVLFSILTFSLTVLFSYLFYFGSKKK